MFKRAHTCRSTWFFWCNVFCIVDALEFPFLFILDKRQSFSFRNLIILCTIKTVSDVGCYVKLFTDVVSENAYFLGFGSLDEFETSQVLSKRYEYYHSVKISFSPENDLYMYFWSKLKIDFADIRAHSWWTVAYVHRHENCS